MNWTLQFTRYGIVGAISNSVGYLIYLAITYAGMRHKLAMTLLFVVGILLTFFFNKRWTFKSRGHWKKMFVYYVVTYSTAYLLNFLALLFFVDRLGYPHQLVQGFAVLALGVMLFIALRLWVLGNTRDRMVGKDVTQQSE
jgi:putative flippase GtrA